MTQRKAAGTRRQDEQPRNGVPQEAEVAARSLYPTASENERGLGLRELQARLVAARGPSLERTWES